MSNLELLDDDLIKEKNDDLLKSLRWWEKKRVLYNLILLGIIIFIIFSRYDAFLYFGVYNGIIGSILFLLVANFFFCMGWILEILIYYYFKKGYQFIKTLRMFLFIIGISISIFQTFIMYHVALIQTPF